LNFLCDLYFSSVTDAEAVSMSRYLVKHDGLFLGSSSACNLVACIKLAKKMGWRNGQTIVTILSVSLALPAPSASDHHIGAIQVIVITQR
jgi:threonine synthase